MTINLYTCTDDSNVVNKTLDTPLSLTGTLRESCSIFSPTMNIEAETLVGKNYAYIEEFGRYYFITDIVSEYENLWRVSMRVDVLMSFKNEFLECPAIIARNEERYNRYLSDDRVLHQANPIIMTLRFPGDHFSKDNIVLAVAGSKSGPSDIIDQLLELAFSELGYLEKASNSDLDSKRGNPGYNNYTKYSRDLDYANYFSYDSQGLAWCSTFANWCFWKKFGIENALTMLYEPDVGNVALRNTKWYEYFDDYDAIVHTPQRGDIVFFDWDASGDIDHCGIVYQIDTENNRLTTIEGNTLPQDASSTYDGVYLRTRLLNSTSIVGYGRPNWGVLRK